LLNTSCKLALAGGIPGVAAYGFYMLIMAPPTCNSSGDVTPLNVRDNTYIEPPFFLKI